VTMSRLKLGLLPPNADDASPRHVSGLRGEPVLDEGTKETKDSKLYDSGHGDPNDPSLVALIEHSGVLRTIRVTDDGSRVRRFQFQTVKNGVASSTGRPWWQFTFIPGQPGAILVVQAESQNLLFTSLPKSESEPSLVYLLGKHSAPVTSLAVSRDGSLTATGTEDGSLAVWALDDGHKVAGMRAAHDGLVRCVALSAEKTLVSAGRDGVVRIWDVATEGPRLRMLHRLASEQLKYVVSLAVTHGESEFTVAAGSSDGCLHVWSVSTRESSAHLLKVLDHNEGLAVTCLSFRRDEALLAMGTQEIGETIGKGTLQLFSTRDWSTVASHSLISPCLTCDYLESSDDRLLVCTPQMPPQIFDSALKVSGLRRARSTPSKSKSPVETPKLVPKVALNVNGHEEEFVDLERQVDEDFDVEAELMDHMADLGVTDPAEVKRLAEAHIHAIAATKVSRTIPLHKKTYPNLSKPPENVPVTKERKTTKKLDPKWLEIKDLGPRLSDMWVFEEREEQVIDTYGMRMGTLLLPPKKGIEF